MFFFILTKKNIYTEIKKYIRKIILNYLDLHANDNFF